MFVLLIFTSILTLCVSREQNVLMTEVFEIIVDPPMFNWTYEGRKDQFRFEASLANAPDLPSWVHFVYSDRHHSGFLYGVPPSKKAIVPLEIVGLNKKNYETRVENVNIIIQEKLNPARYEVHMKIDNINVQDMFDVERMDSLKDIFRRQLWKDSEEDLYVTFLESAVELGARKPLNPKGAEGVVLRLGSENIFSQELLEFQEEIKPLYKLETCSFKRTSVDRFFREAGFTLDWCSFKLIQKDENNNSAMHKSEIDEDQTEITSPDEEWIPFSRSDIPARTYTQELIFTVSVPMVMMVLLVLALTFILCFQHDDLRDEESDYFFENLYHICSDWYNQRLGLSEESVISTQDQSPQKLLGARNPTDTLQSFSMPNCSIVHREHSLSPDPMILGMSHPNSPNSSITRGMHCRPSPPPYVRPKFKPEI